MSKKMRIAISCILAVLAFGLGIAVYARENGNKAEVATADSEDVYFVNEAGKITIPTEPAATTDAEKLANKVNRGRSADNPFFVLEIVPYDMWAEFGYKIAGCEPIDMDFARWYGLSLPSGNYTVENAVYEYWDSEVPDKFPKSDVNFQKTVNQYGVMKQVTDNSGNYTKDGFEYVKYSELPQEMKDAYEGALYKQDGSSYVEDTAGEYIQRDKFKKVENGDYLWTPLTPTECETIKNNNLLLNPYKYSLHVPDVNGEFLSSFANVTYYQTTNGKKYTHNNAFVLESVGLAYKMVDGVRVDIRTDGSAAEKAQMWADVEEFSKNCIVYTVTPEELNINLGLIDRADMIYIKGTATDSGYITFNKDYGRKDRFEHATTAIATRDKNNSSANFNTNPLDWAATVKIYEAVTNDLKPVPIIMDTAAYNNCTASSADVPIVFHNYETDKKGTGGSKNNLYKLFLLLHQMPTAVLESYYGSPADASNAIFGSKNTGLSNKDGSVIKTGIINFNKIPYIAAKQSAKDHVNKSEFNDSAKDAKEIWNVYTLLPWELVPTKSSSYQDCFDTLEIKSNDGFYQFNAGGAQDSLQDAMYLYCGNTAMNQGFNTMNAIDRGAANFKYQYVYPIYDYFESIGVSKDGFTSAEVLYYLLNGLRNSNSPTATTDADYKVLEIQPSQMFVDGRGADNKYIISGPSTFWTTLIKTYTNTTGNVTVDRITTKELIGKNIEYLSEYDLIYFGLNKDAADVTMNTTFVYAHTGPMVTFSSYDTDADGSSSLFGWLYTGDNVRRHITNVTEQNIEKQFVYSGNDITRRVLVKLQAYGDQGYPVLFADGFYTSTSPSNADHIVSTVDHNSYVYDVASEINKDNYLYMGSLSDSSTHMTEAAKLRNALRKSTEVQWLDFSYPKLYNVNAVASSGDTPTDSDYLDGQTLKFEFTLKAPAGKKYKAVLSTDINGDGKYTSDEIVLAGLNFSVREVIGASSYSVTNGTLENGKRYRITRDSIERVGSVSWKLDLVEVKADGSDGGIMQSVSGVSAIKASVANADAVGADKRVTIKVLQILSDARQKIYLPMEGEVSGGNVNIPGVTLSASQKEETKWFYEDTKDLEDFKIVFVRTTIEELENAITHNENYLKNQGYDMIVLGFADAYEGITSNTLLDAIERFRLAGKAILYTHDNSSMVGKGVTTLNKNFTWGTELTLKFRDAFGMDRYDVLGFKADASKKTLKTESVDGRADIPYLPTSNTSEIGKVQTASGSGHTTSGKSASDFMLAQGLSNGILYRHIITDSGVSNITSNKITSINTGGITQYPYTIPQSITIAETHPQYYQLDLETDNIVVWYTLGDQEGGGSTGNNTVTKYYNSSPKDVRNNYYIYNIDNVTYSGMGHESGMTREEVRLFINTFIAAYRPAANGASVKIENDEVSGDGNGYYLLIDVDPQTAGSIRMINDAQPGYYSQKAVKVVGTETVVPGEYERGEWDETDSKRVYFKIKDGSDYAIREYNFSFKVDGVEKELAVFLKTDGEPQFMNHSFAGDNESDVNTSNYANTFYVDVPISTEAVVDESGNTTYSVVDTVLEIYTDARYKLSSTTTSWIEQDDPSITKVTITPRGLFDLD